MLCTDETPESLKENTGESELEKEVERLKRKVNALLELRETLLNQIQNLELTCEVIEKNQNGSGDKPDDNLRYTYTSRIYSFLQELKKVGCWVEHKNNTSITKKYYRIEKADLETLLDSFLEESLDKGIFLDLMYSLGIVKAVGESRYLIHSATVNGRARRVYLIRKTAIEAACTSLKGELWKKEME